MSTNRASAEKPINYKEVYFNYATLSKVTGNPTYNDLQSLYKQVKDNGASVPSTLGGDRHGHLGLVTNTSTYARIDSWQPFCSPHSASYTWREQHRYSRTNRRKSQEPQSIHHTLPSGPPCWSHNRQSNPRCPNLEIFDIWWNLSRLGFSTYGYMFSILLYVRLLL